MHDSPGQQPPLSLPVIDPKVCNLNSTVLSRLPSNIPTHTLACSPSVTLTCSLVLKPMVKTVCGVCVHVRQHELIAIVSAMLNHLQDPVLLV